MGTHFARIVAGGVIGMLVAGCAVKKPDGGPAGLQKAAGEFMPMPAFGTLPAGKIERLDPALDVLIPPGAQVEMLVSGLDWCEGPTWVKAGPLTKTPGVLFCDIPQNTVYKLDPNTRQIEVFVKPSGYTALEPRGGEVGSNGIVIGPDGSLVLCQHGDRRLAKWVNGQFITIAESYEGKRFNSPNDLVFDRNGNLFFTDPPYGLEKNMADPKKELDFQGVYRVTPEGKLTLLTKEISRPNGIALSPDEQTLYVAVSDPKDAKIYAFDVKADGTLANKRVFFDCQKLMADKARKGLPDGLDVDRQGNVLCGGPGGVIVLSPAGKHLGTVMTGEKTSNIAWGDDGGTLYMTADSYILRIRTGTKGKGW